VQSCLYQPHWDHPCKKCGHLAVVLTSSHQPYNADTWCAKCLSWCNNVPVTTSWEEVPCSLETHARPSKPRAQTAATSSSSASTRASRS
jgi:hypothetical protein